MSASVHRADGMSDPIDHGQKVAIRLRHSSGRRRECIVGTAGLYAASHQSPNEHPGAFFPNRGPAGRTPRHSPGSYGAGCETDTQPWFPPPPCRTMNPFSMGPTPRLEHAPGGTGPHDPNAPIALRRRSGPGRATRLRFGLALVFLAAATPRLFSYSPGDDRIVGGEFIYTVRRGDSLTAIGARFGVDPLMLARSNGLSPRSRLSVGQSLQVDNRHVVPTAMDEGILINVPQRLLFLFHAGALVAWYPVGLGRPDWETVLGRFAVRTKEREPTWHVPVSIQEEMREHGEPVRTEVAPGPDNPLGKYWMGLTGSACGVHGTIAPASIYGFRTHGCIRLHPDDIADLFPRVVVGTPVRIATSRCCSWAGGMDRCSSR